MKSENFEILRLRWPELAALGGFAEAYAHDDPASALVKLRLFAENLTKDMPTTYSGMTTGIPDAAGQPGRSVLRRGRRLLGR
jgi:hypothetical protein